ncbi:MAG: response regulator [Rubrivivax sp.]|nr:response regulator [Rubrivivax sp.]
MASPHRNVLNAGVMAGGAALAAVAAAALAMDLQALRAPLPAHLGLVLATGLLAWGLGCRRKWRRAESPAEATDSQATLQPAAPTAADRMPMLAAEIGTDHRCRWASTALARWLDVRVQELEDQGFNDALGALSAGPLGAAIGAALQGQPQRLHCPHHALASGQRWLLVELQPMRDDAGRVDGCQFMALEITAEQLELDDARASERRLRLIMDQIPVTVSYIDAGMKYRYINRAQEQWLGKTAAEVLNRDVRDVAGDNVFADIEPNLRRALAGESVQLERERTDRDGRKVWHSGRHVPDANADGQVVGLYTVFFDITQRAQAELQLVQREQELRLAKEAAENASRAKSEFLANMSHEIRTPMNGVLGLTELLLETPLDPQQRPFVETVRNSGESLLSIINDILDFSKIEAGKLETEMLEFDLYQVIEDVVQLLAPRAHAKQLELACRIDETLPAAVRGDPYRLRQVLTNLVGNALKFTDNGEVVVEVTGQTDTDGRPLLQVAVRDSGIGIGDDQRERLFKPFAQADGSTTRRFGGTGLGLAISRSLVELMGGKIGVHSHTGQGSTFWFELPLQAASSLPPVPTPKNLTGHRVLVVDDNATNREIVLHHLAAGDVRGNEAADGLEALEILRREQAAGRPFDLVIVDMKMPHMDGIELARTLRADPALAALPLVLLTSLHSRAEVSRARAAGIQAYLSKPVRRQELFRALASCLIESDFGKLDDAHPGTNGAVICADRHQDLRIDAHVLLAEDNGVNQVVARNMLKAMGCTYEIVANGRLALEALTAGTYDLVLMDCQMPQMDGYEATRAIRELEAARGGNRTPVVALTANALVGDAEVCRASGMDDHLAKPYTRKQLAQVMKRWLPDDKVSHAAAPAQTADAPKSSTDDDSVLDQAALDNIRAIDDGEGSVIREVIEMFLAEAPGHLQNLDAALERSDGAAVGQVAHALKSASFNVGAARLGETARDLERAGKAGDLTAAKRLVGSVNGLFQRVVPLLRAEMARTLEGASA